MIKTPFLNQATLVEHTQYSDVRVQYYRPSDMKAFKLVSENIVTEEKCDEKGNHCLKVNSNLVFITLDDVMKKQPTVIIRLLQLLLLYY